jgi:hypothetical protein
MQERAFPRGWIERRSVERRCDADTPIRILGAALCAYGQPTASIFARRGIWMALGQRVLTKPNRSGKVGSRQRSPMK